jgi:hypothetical protein
MQISLPKFTSQNDTKHLKSQTKYDISNIQHHLKIYHEANHSTFQITKKNVRCDLPQENLQQHQNTGVEDLL